MFGDNVPRKVDNGGDVRKTYFGVEVVVASVSMQVLRASEAGRARVVGCSGILAEMVVEMSANTAALESGDIPLVCCGSSRGSGSGGGGGRR